MCGFGRRMECEVIEDCLQPGRVTQRLRQFVWRYAEPVGPEPAVEAPAGDSAGLHAEAAEIYTMSMNIMADFTNLG